MHSKIAHDKNTDLWDNNSWCWTWSTYPSTTFFWNGCDALKHVTAQPDLSPGPVVSIAQSGHVFYPLAKHRVNWIFWCLDGICSEKKRKESGQYQNVKGTVDHKASAIRDITKSAQRHSVLRRKAIDRLLLWCLKVLQSRLGIWCHFCTIIH